MPNEITDAMVEAAAGALAGSMWPLMSASERALMSASERDSRWLRARAALEAAEAARVVVANGSEIPNGWKLVPTEPTNAMMLAFFDAARLWQDEIGENEDVYRAMLAASPAAPVPAEGEGWRDILRAHQDTAHGFLRAAARKVNEQ
jgi:hypothetical protein